MTIKTVDQAVLKMLISHFNSDKQNQNEYKKTFFANYFYKIQRFLIFIFEIRNVLEWDAHRHKLGHGTNIKYQ